VPSGESSSHPPRPSPAASTSALLEHSAPLLLFSEPSHLVRMLAVPPEERQGVGAQGSEGRMHHGSMDPPDADTTASAAADAASSSAHVAAVTLHAVATAARESAGRVARESEESWDVVRGWLQTRFVRGSM